MPRYFAYVEFRRTTIVDDYLVPVDERWSEPERDIHETPLDCAMLQSEMLATLAQRDHARRRAAALTASRERREG